MSPPSARGLPKPLPSLSWGGRGGANGFPLVCPLWYSPVVSQIKISPWCRQTLSRGEEFPRGRPGPGFRIGEQSSVVLGPGFTTSPVSNLGFVGLGFAATLRGCQGSVTHASYPLSLTFARGMLLLVSRVVSNDTRPLFLQCFVCVCAESFSLSREVKSAVSLHAHSSGGGVWSTGSPRVADKYSRVVLC